MRQALAVARGNLSRAAELLGVTRPTLYDLLDVTHRPRTIRRRSYTYRPAIRHMRTRAPGNPQPRIVNAFSIDVEDYFQVEALSHVDRARQLGAA